jgi:hypothetical protein
MLLPFKQVWGARPGGGLLPRMLRLLRGELLKQVWGARPLPLGRPCLPPLQPALPAQLLQRLLPLGGLALLLLLLLHCWRCLRGLAPEVGCGMLPSTRRRLLLPPGKVWGA